MAAQGNNTVVTFDERTAARVIKATRAVEAAGLVPERTRAERVPIGMEIVVPRSEDAGGWYLCDLYWFNPATDDYELLLENQKMRLLPDTL